MELRDVPGRSGTVVPVSRPVSPYRVLFAGWALLVATVWHGRLLPVLFTVFLTVTFGLLLDVPVAALERRGVPRPAGVGIAVAGLLAAVVAFGFAVVPTVSAELSTLGDRYGSLDAMIVDRANVLLGSVPVEVGPLTTDQVNVGRLASRAANPDVLGRVGTAFTELFVALFAAAWAVAHPRSVADRLLRFVRPGHRDRVRAVAGKVERRLRSWLAGQLVLCASIGVGSYVVFRALGVPFALLFAVMAGILEAVPAIGIFIASVPPVLLVLAEDPSRAVWLVLAIVGLQQLEDRVLVPQVMRRAVDIPQAILLLVLFAFGMVFGAVGLLAAVPLTAAAVTIHDELTARREPDDCDDVASGSDVDPDGWTGTGPAAAGAGAAS